MPLRQGESTEQFIIDMETGGYAPDATSNAVRRLNDVCRKYEAIFTSNPPTLSRQVAQQFFQEQSSASSSAVAIPSRSAQQSQQAPLAP